MLAEFGTPHTICAQHTVLGYYTQFCNHTLNLEKNVRFWNHMQVLDTHTQHSMVGPWRAMAAAVQPSSAGPRSGAGTGACSGQGAASWPFSISFPGPRLPSTMKL